MPRKDQDILDKLEDLHKQATTERSHYYVAACCREAIVEIATLRAQLRAAHLKGSVQPPDLETLLRKMGG